MLKFNLERWWSTARRTNAFKGGISENTVKGVNAIFEAWRWEIDTGRMPKEYIGNDILQAKALSLLLANVRIEVGAEMMPVWEGFQPTYEASVAFIKRQGYWYAKPQGPHGMIYPGGGHIQVTHYDNVLKMGKAIGEGDLTKTPQRLTELKISARIAVDGCVHGRFRNGHWLAKYCKGTGINGFMGREVVNGDKNKVRGRQGIGSLCDDLAEGFYDCFEAAMRVKPDPWKEGDPKLWDPLVKTKPKKGTFDMVGFLSKIRPLLGVGGIGGLLQSCSQNGSFTADPTQMGTSGLFGLLLASILAPDLLKIFFPRKKDEDDKADKKDEADFGR